MKRLEEFTKDEKLFIIGGTEEGEQPTDAELFDCWFGGCKEGCKESSKTCTHEPGHDEPIKSH